MNKTILQAAALIFALAATGVMSCQSQGAQSQGGGGGMCGGTPQNDADCNAHCGYGTYQYKCECRADTKYEASNNNAHPSNGTTGSTGDVGQGVSH